MHSVEKRDFYSHNPLFSVSSSSEMKPQQQLLLMRVSSVKSRDCEAVPTTSSATNAPISNKLRKDQIMQRTTSTNATNNGNSEDKSIQQQSK